MFSHFARADEKDKKYAYNQMGLYNKMVEYLNELSVDIPVNNEYGLSMVNETLIIISIAVCLLFLLAWIVIIVKKSDKYVAIPFVSVLLIMPVFVAAYHTYIEWIEIPYYICAAVIGALATVTPVCIAKAKGKSKKSIDNALQRITKKLRGTFN